MQSWKVKTAESGMTLNAFLKHKFENTYSAKQLKQAIEHNLCRVNQRVERFASTRVAAGDQIECDLTQLSALLTSSPIKFEAKRILYEDADLFVYDKPAGVSCDAAGIVRIVHQKDPSLQLVHRLDKETTGVLLFVKSDDALHKMIHLFKTFKVRKIYYAIVDGIVHKEKGSIDNQLAPQHKYQGQTIWGQTRHAKGVHAHTDWIKEKKGQDCSLIRCYPVTGVTHQIRVHLSEMGHPILGDYQYRRHFVCRYKAPRYLLHAYEIVFPHPQTEKEMRFIAQFPLDFKQALEQLRLR